MKSMKIMLSAMLLSLSLGAYAQDEDELLEAAEEETTEASVPTAITAKRFFQRVQFGYTGTSAKYTNNNPKREVTTPQSEKYFLSGISLGWAGDLRLNQRIPVFFEIGANFTYHTGAYDGNDYSNSSVRYDWHSRINAFTISIPVGISYQFRDVWKEGLTIAPFAGVYGRFNLVAERGCTWTSEGYNVVTGEKTWGPDQTYERKSLMKYEEDGGWMEGRSHVGKLFQPGVMVGVNAYYKRYTVGLAYMYDLIPFAQHDSPLGLTSKAKDVGGFTQSSGTGCDMKISTSHNFSITVGYVF